MYGNFVPLTHLIDVMKGEGCRNLKWRAQTQPARGQSRPWTSLKKKTCSSSSILYDYLKSGISYLLPNYKKTAGRIQQENKFRSLKPLKFKRTYLNYSDYFDNKLESLIVFLPFQSKISFKRNKSKEEDADNQITAETTLLPQQDMVIVRFNFLNQYV